MNKYDVSRTRTRTPVHKDTQVEPNSDGYVRGSRDLGRKGHEQKLLRRQDMGRNDE